MSLPQDAAKMARDGGIETPKLAPNAFTTDKIFQIGQGEFIGRDNLQSGTGNVGATQSYPDISLTSALSAPFNATTAWRSLSAYLNQVAATNTSPASVWTNEVINKFSGSVMFEGATLAPNGCLYLIPGDGGANVIAKFNPNDNSVSTIATISVNGTRSYTGSVLHPNGKIYLIPHDATVFRFIDPSNDTVTTFGTYVINPVLQDSYSSGVVAPNGKIYCSPHDATVGRWIDPSTNTITTFSFPLANINTAYGQALLGPNGKIYFIPIAQTVWSMLDPNNDTITAVATYGANYGAVLAPNGFIYCTGTPSFKFNPNDNTITTFNFNYVGNSKGTLHPNGRIYFITTQNTQIAVIDPSNDTGTYIYTGFPLAAYNDITLLPNGKLFLTPYTSTQSNYINNNTNNNFNQNVCLSPFINTN